MFKFHRDKHLLKAWLLWILYLSVPVQCRAVHGQDEYGKTNKVLVLNIELSYSLGVGCNRPPQSYFQLPKSVFILSLPLSSMASSPLYSLSSTISRLNLLPRLSLPFALTCLNPLRQKSDQHLERVRSPPSPSSIHLSASKPSISPSPCRAVPNGDDLVVLGIETSCDDTAAAVVSLQFSLVFCRFLGVSACQGGFKC